MTAPFFVEGVVFRDRSARLSQARHPFALGQR
jgi:hypothetical protein